MRHLTLLMGAASTLGLATAVQAQTITIATVNNGDMVRMQSLTPEFNKQYPDIKINWVTLEENILRERVTTDIATQGGQYDIMTIGTYEVPIWAKQEWLTPLDNLGDNYDVEDIIPNIASGLSYEGTLYAAPFYGESSFTMYRQDLMQKAGMEMPDKPDWDFMKQAADAMTDKAAGVSGICLRGKAGWGENMAFITALANSYGARWFDENWNPQFDTQQWHDALQFYVDLMTADGPEGASSNGFNENLALFQQGKCGMWIDATVAGSFVTDPTDSTVADNVSFALAPDKGLGKRANWLWAWSLAIPASTKNAEAAETFVSWATSKAYAELVASKEGWANVPPGTRTSLYENQDYLDAAPFAQMTLESIQNADPEQPTVDPVPYVGVQFVAIPEFQSIGTTVGQLFAAALAGQMSVDDALMQAQTATTREMTRAGYIK